MNGHEAIDAGASRSPATLHPRCTRSRQARMPSAGTDDLGPTKRDTLRAPNRPRCAPYSRAATAVPPATVPLRGEYQSTRRVAYMIPPRIAKRPIEPIRSA